MAKPAFCFLAGDQFANLTGASQLRNLGTFDINHERSLHFRWGSCCAIEDAATLSAEICMGVRKAVLAVVILSVGGVQPAAATPWTLTVYGGAATDTIFSDTITGKGRFNSAMIGVAFDRHLANLGWGLNLVGEVQVQQFEAIHSRDYIEGSGNYPAVAVGLGVEYHDFAWSQNLPTSFSVFMGPSYSFDPPLTYARADWGSRKALLNYLGIELALAVPGEHHMDAVLRLYHRSGAWGVYTEDADEASVLGIGLRYHF